MSAPLPSRASPSKAGGRRLAVLALLAVTGLTVPSVAACSGDDETKVPTSASSAATSSGSPAVSSTESAGTDGDATTVPEIEDAADLAAVMTAAMRRDGTVKLHAVASSRAGTSTGNSVGKGADAARFDGRGSMRIGDDPALQLAVTTGGQQVRLRMVEGAVYVGLGRQIMGKSWFRLDPDGQDAVSKNLGGLVATLRGALGVDGSVSGFDRAASFKKTGPLTVDGVPTQGFEVVLENDATTTYRIHLDDAGRPVRTVVEAREAGRGSTLTVDYTDWGTPVTINPPPADQVR